jgi:hypothetical protein
MAAQSASSEEQGIKVALLRSALLTPCSSDGVKNVPIASAKKQPSVFSLTKVEEERNNTLH